MSEHYQDEVEEGDELVRAFVATGGRATTDVSEIPFEALVSIADSELIDSRDRMFERGRILAHCDDAIGVAELAARIDLPIRACLVLLSELVADEVLMIHDVIEHADHSLLVRIRSAIMSA